MRKVSVYTAIVSGLLLSGCGNSAQNTEDNNSFIEAKSTIVKSNDGEVKFTFETNKGATYEVIDKDNDDDVIASGTAKTGSVTISGQASEGKIKVISKYKGHKATKTFTIVSDSDQDSTSKEDENNSYKVGQEAKLMDASENPMYGIKVTSVTKSFDDHGKTLLQEKDVPSFAISNEKSVQISVKYTNYDDDENFLPLLQDFAIYDANRLTGEIVSQQEGQTEVSKGHSGITTFWVNFTENTPKGSKIEIVYQPDGLNTPITFDAVVN